MTVRDWVQLQALIVASWPHTRQLTEEQLRLQHRIVEHLGRDQAAEAIVAHARSGSDFPPTPGQVAKACALSSVGRAPSWSSAQGLLKQAAGRFGYLREAEALAWLAERSAHVAEWVTEQGWRALCREHIEEGVVQQRLERAYTQHAQQVDRDIAAGRPLLAATRRLQQLERGSAGQAGGLRRVRALDAVGMSDELTALPASTTRTTDSEAA